MTHQKFQTEPVASEPAGSDRHREPFGITAMASMLLGLKLRGHLTDSEAQWLDMLAPHNWLAVLIDGDEYLHPAGVTLFPVEMIVGGWQHQPNAVFSRRLPPGPELANRWHRIHTAVIQLETDRPLILGFFGAEDRLADQSIEERFFVAVELFRRASQMVEESWPEIEAMLTAPEPTLLVNRSSGRVLAANPTAESIFGDKTGDLVDREYSQVREFITDMSAGRSIRMRNFHAAGLDFCLMRWPGQDVELEQFEDASEVLAEPNQCLARIIRATHLLTENENVALTPRQRSLLEDIFEAARDLARSSSPAENSTTRNRVPELEEV